MYYDLSKIPLEACDKLLHSIVVPRPIAWVSTMDAMGRPNLAPFSFFNVFSTDPPIVGLGIGRREPGMPKHTARNIQDTGEFVINLVSYDNRHAMNATGADVSDGVDESQLAGLQMLASSSVKPKRVSDSPASMECILHQSIELAPNRYLILGRVLILHIADEVIEDMERFYVAAQRLDLIGRMHGQGWYARTNNLFQMKRIR